MRYVLLALPILILAGCKTTFFVDSEPQGAEVVVNGKPAGTTPAYVKLPMSSGFNKDRVVVVQKEGYHSVSTQITNVRTWYGHWYWFPERVFVRLAKIEQDSK